MIKPTYKLSVVRYIVISGSKTMDDFDAFEKFTLDSITDFQYTHYVNNGDLVIIRDRPVRGADDHTQRFCKKYSLKELEIPIDWNDLETQPVFFGQNFYGQYNTLAYVSRNTKAIEMARKSDGALIVFDCKEKNVKDSIRQAKVAGIKIYKKVENKNET